MSTKIIFGIHPKTRKLRYVTKIKRRKSERSLENLNRWSWKIVLIEKVVCDIYFPSSFLKRYDYAREEHVHYLHVPYDIMKAIGKGYSICFEHFHRYFLSYNLPHLYTSLFNLALYQFWNVVNHSRVGICLFYLFGKLILFYYDLHKKKIEGCFFLYNLISIW